MIHWKKNLLCAVDVETTGLDSRYNEIIQICILPLDSNLKPHQQIRPFYTMIKPEHPERIDKKAMEVNNLAEKLLTALDGGKVADLLVEWFEGLKLPMGKKIIPLAQNWPFDRSFLIEWLGQKTFEMIFDYEYRDTKVAAVYLNDRAIRHADPVPFARVGLAYISSQLSITNPAPHDAMGDCITTAEAYRLMLSMGSGLENKEPLTAMLKAYCRPGETAIQALERLIAYSGYCYSCAKSGEQITKEYNDFDIPKKNG